jgi:hypothetical protein
VRAAPLPSHEQAAEAVVPRVGAFDDPTPRLAADLADQRLFAAPSNMCSDSAYANRGGDVRVVVALVEAKVLRASRAAGTSHDHCIKNSADHRRVRHVGSADQCSERDTATVGQDVPFYATFRAVRRIWPREVPPFGAFTEALSRELHFHAIPRRPS